jgi:hypothetical protein
MATNEEVLRAFVVSLGWKNEAAQQKQFVGAIESATLKANLLADGIAAMAKSVARSIEGASQNFLQLGILADQTRTSIGTILSLQQALTQFGGSAGEANSILSTINNSLRSMNDGNLAYAEKFGIHQNKVTKQITVDLADGQRALAGLSDAAVTQFAELAHIPQSVAELIQHHGEEMQAALDKAQKTIAAFGIDQGVVDTQMRYARAINAIYFDLDQAWTKLTTSIESPLTPALEKVDEWLVTNAPTISGSLDEIGAAFKTDVIDPLASIAGAADSLQTDAQKIDKFKESVVSGLSGIKELIDDAKEAYTYFHNLSDNMHRAGKSFGEDTGLNKIGPALGLGGPDHPIDPSDEAVREKYALPPLLGVLPSAPKNPVWWNPLTWGMKYDPAQDSARPSGRDEMDARRRRLNDSLNPANLPSNAATPKAFEDEGGGGFRIPGEDQSITLKSGGTAVQSGNPLPVRIEKIDPAAGGDLSGVGGGSGGGGAGGEGGHGRGGLIDRLRGRGTGGGSPSGTGPPGKTADAMKFAMDQLRKEGVPEKNLKNAAAVMVGEAIAESGLRPTTVHDNGTGYGIYGARLERRDKMLAWLQANGYPKDSLEPEFWGEVQPPASLKGLDIPPRRAVFVPWKPSRRPAFGMGNPTFR